MRIKIMPVLFLTVAIICMNMLANTPVLAQAIQPESTWIDLGDQYCTEEEAKLQLCFNVDIPYDGIVDYVVQIEPYQLPGGVDLAQFDPTTLDWPILDGNGTVTFRYRAFVSPLTDCVKVDTWNYFVQRQSASIADKLLMTVPPGAQLLLPGDAVTKCRDFVAEDGYNLLKMNPSLNCSAGNQVIFSFTYTDNVLLGFGNPSVVTTKSGCEGGGILGPNGDALPFHAEQSHSFPLGGSVDVVFNPLSSGGEDLVESVTINGELIAKSEEKAWICTPAPEGSVVGDDYIVNHPDLGLMLCIEPEKAGLQKQGCVVDANPRTYLIGGDVYTGR